MPGLLLLRFNEFLFPLPLIIGILLNVEFSERERQRRMRRFRRRTNRRKITKWWDTNSPTMIYNRHYTNIFASIYKYCPLYFFLVLLWFVHPVKNSVSQLLQFNRLVSHPKLVNKIETNIPLCSVKIDLMHCHIPPLVDVLQEIYTSLHLKINKRHR